MDRRNGHGLSVSLSLARFCDDRVGISGIYQDSIVRFVWRECHCFRPFIYESHT